MGNQIRIKRIDTYDDSRFSQAALYQHGCFLVNEIPHEITITSEQEAVIRGAALWAYPALIEEFRFYAPHIACFYNEQGGKIAEYPRVQRIRLRLEEIQPSQFYVDKDKLAAVRTFIHRADDIIVPVLPAQGKYISLDGHTRLFYAVSMGWDRVGAVIGTADEWAYQFADEAQRRGITAPKDLLLVSHEEYEEKWNRFCDRFFE